MTDRGGGGALVNAWISGVIVVFGNRTVKLQGPLYLLVASHRWLET